MKRKLLFAMLCIVSALGLNAQTWTASEVGAGNFYLYNVGKGQFLTRGNGWGTQASVGFSALTLTVEEYDGAYKLRTNVNGDGKGLERLGDPVIYTDQSAGKNATWTFTKVDDASNGPVYTIVSKDNHGGGAGSYMTASADNTIVGPADAVTDDYGRWQLIQSWITNNMPVSDANGWTTSQDPTFDKGNICAEFWNKSAASIKQTLTNLPAGSYELIAVAFTREGMTATLNAGSKTMNIATASTSEANNRGAANTWFNNGNGVNKLEFTHAGGNLEIGLTADNTTGDHWLVWRSFVLLYKGLDLAALKVALQEQIDAVPALEGTTTTAAYNAAKNYADGIDMDALTTEEAVSTASSELASLVDAAKALQTSYARYNDIKTSAKGIATSLDTTTPDAALDAATTNDAAIAAIAALRAAFLAELPNVEIPADPGFIDVTAVMVDNAGVHTNTDYWTAVENGSARTGGSWAVCNYGECEFYNNNFKFYQTLALSTGTWEFGVTGFHRAGNHNTHFYAGEDKILIPGVANTVVNSMAQAKDYFDNGNGLVALKFVIDSNQDVEIGIDNQDTETDKWTIFRDFTLKYYGAPDYTIYDQQWSDAVTAANEALEAQAYKNVSGSERTAVTDAIADAPDGSSKANYLEKIQTLEAATATFKAAAPSYDAYVAYKAETIALWATDFEVKAPTTAAEAVSAVAQLNVAQYNNVKDNYTYSLDGLIGDFGTWTGTATVAGEAAEPNYLDWEHWSGVTHAYYEQASAGYGNAAGWTIKYEKTCKLPAGNYVLKVAARSSAGTTSKVSCSAIPTTISLPCAGNNTRGINTKGEASWADEDEFISTGGLNATVGGTGGGWQWRFLPFELDKVTEVTMTFYAEATTQYQWMSIGDAVLLSDDDPAEEVDYNDDEDNTIESALIANVTVNREIKADFNTVVLPFNVTAVQVAEIFGEGTKVYNFSENSENAETAEIKFQSGDGSITANVPVLVKATKASNAQEFKGVVVEEPASDIKVAGKFIDFVGTYAPVDVAEGDYFVGNGALYRSEGNTSMNAFRAFLKVKSAEVKAELFIDGVATAIESINGNGAQPAGAIYNLAGQRVQKAQRGLYIVNGKKIVVK